MPLADIVFSIRSDILSVVLCVLSGVDAVDLAYTWRHKDNDVIKLWQLQNGYSYGPQISHACSQRQSEHNP